MLRVCALFLSCAVFSAALPGCGGESLDAPGPVTTLRLATTTSADNSGLLDILLPPFEKKHNIRVHVVAVGSGQALTLGRNGDADVLIVHDPAGEAQFVNSGFGVGRRQFAHNDFVILGPADGPVGVKTVASAKDVLAAIAAAEIPFVSRGDDSGTHRKELALWKAAGIEPGGSWYMEVGQGMSGALMVAANKGAYILSDRATYLAMRDELPLTILHEGDTALANPYSVIAVNPERRPNVHHREATLLIDWVTSTEGQEIIADFRRFGRQLFHPDAMPPAQGEAP